MSRAPKPKQTHLMKRGSNRAFFIGLSRAVGGAIVFSLPLLMTMEMWTLGSSIDGGRLGLFVAITIPLLVGLSHYAGFEETFCLRDDVVDAFVALAVGFCTSAAILWLTGVISL